MILNLGYPIEDSRYFRRLEAAKNDGNPFEATLFQAGLRERETVGDRDRERQRETERDHKMTIKTSTQKEKKEEKQLCYPSR